MKTEVSFVCRWSKITLLLCAGRKGHDFFVGGRNGVGLCVRVEIDLILV